MASKRRNMFYENKKQETTEIDTQWTLHIGPSSQYKYNAHSTTLVGGVTRVIGSMPGQSRAAVMPPLMTAVLSLTLIQTGITIPPVRAEESNGSLSIYYDPIGAPVPLVDSDSHDNRLIAKPLKYGHVPCSCNELSCKCCANIYVHYYKKYARNPPSACLETLVSHLPSVGFCVRLYDIVTTGDKLRVCVNFETRLVRTPVLVLQFDCVQLNADGITFVKPANSTRTP
ncbi:hypothetical protein AAG570_013135 [Ranatra chinensis]|uniref:DUF4773 domain-containing protein n=1 Tax=Ranatra chinensis TaxID=642074 RepID=A0ABD0YSD1_9HEMI